MAEPESSEQLLQKLCDLQEQQIQMLKELSNTVSEIAAASHITQEHSRKQFEEYADAQKKYSAYLLQVTRGRIPALILLGLIVVAIIVSHFL